MAEQQTQTKTAEPEAGPQPEPMQEEQTSKITVAAPRFPWKQTFKDQYDIDQSHWRALIDAVYPSAQSLGAVLMALSYCKKLRVDPMLKPVHIVPVWNSALRRNVETVWPGINLYRVLAHRSGEFAGMEDVVFGPAVKETFKGRIKVKGDRYEEREETVIFPEWAQIVGYRMINGTACKFYGPKVHWKATYGRQQSSIVPNERWTKAPFDQLEKCAEAAFLRRVFPEVIPAMPTDDEMDGVAAEAAQGHIIDHEEDAEPEPTEAGERAKAQEQAEGTETKAKQDLFAPGDDAKEPLTVIDADSAEHDVADGDKWRIAVLKLMEDAPTRDDLEGVWRANSPLLSDDRIGEKNAKIVRDAHLRFYALKK